MTRIKAIGALGIVAGALAALQGCASQATSDPSRAVEEVTTSHLCAPAYNFPDGPPQKGMDLVGPVAEVEAVNDGSPIALGQTPKGGIRLFATHDANFIEVSRRDYAICGATLKPVAPLRIDLSVAAEGAEAEVLRACAADLSLPSCVILRNYCESGSFEIGATPGVDPSYCRIKPGVRLRAEVFAAERCVMNGIYCGADTIPGDPNVLYRCRGSNEPLSLEVCAHGCEVRPAGQRDVCRASGAPAFPVGPEGAIGVHAAAKDIPYTGDCALTTPDEDLGKLCTSLLRAREGERLYLAGDTFSEFTLVYHVKEQQDGWKVVDTIAVDASGAFERPLPF